MKCLIILLILSVLYTDITLAQEKDENTLENYKEKSGNNNTSNGSCLPGVLSLAPGILLHGTGHFAAGDTDTAFDLLIIEGSSLAVFLGTGLLYAYTGASRKISPIAIPVVLTSGSIFMLSWIGDVYGSSVGMRRSMPGNNKFDSRYIRPFMGLVSVDDIQFEYSQFLHCGFDAQYDAFSISPLLWYALDDDNIRLVLESSYKIIGKHSILYNDINYISVEPVIRIGYHNFAKYYFNKKWLDAGIITKFYPGHIWKSLAGLYIMCELGYNREWVTFTAAEDDPVIASNQLLFESGFGIMLGELSDPFGDLYFYYNHRRDGLAGGMQGGFIGFFGIKFNFNIEGNVAMQCGYSYGSAAVFNMSGSVRF